MATGESRQSIDVSVKEPLGDINKMKPQLYIFGKLASITSKTVEIIQNITHLYHSFHEKDLAAMLNNSDLTINFRGHELAYRIAERQHSSYMIDHDDYDNIQDSSVWKWIYKDRATPLAGIKLLHFATKPFSFSRYGDRVCKIPYDVIITRYLQARKHFSKEKDKIKAVAYRVVCTQIHQKEINHMVIICCDGDDDKLKELPILGPTF